MSYPSLKNKKLFDAILKLKNTQEAAKFFRDLLTLAEIEDFSTRLSVAKLLNENKYSYEQIAKICHVSTTTVTRVSHWLHHGMGGYKLILKRISSNKK